MMNIESLSHAQVKYPIGTLVYGTIEFHAPFGVFVDLGDAQIKGLIQITDFLDTGAMTSDMYPDVGSAVGAVVMGYTDGDRQQVWLSVKPSVLQRSLIQLKLPEATSP